ncbi:MAG: AAA family ATPase [Nitrospira bacterium HGW-Nitrospira-1]|nr:MAG: AAA family ATPase [Nitrospira bacterium HGW-Nitrospira-1]
MDYLEYYKLNKHPFSTVVDSRFYYDSPQRTEALLRLKYAIDTDKGLAVVIGDIGAGKTTLARKMLEELDEEKYEAALLVIIHSSVSSDWLFKKFALQLGVKNIPDNKVQLLGEIYRRLLEINEEGKKTVVLIDEAQMLNSKEIMEDFRGLLNMETSEGKLVNFIFFGLPELDSTLSLDEPLKQRIAIRVKLTVYSEENTSDYIKHRLEVAGRELGVFTPEAIKLVYKYSKGSPRLINTICDNALLDGFLFKKPVIDESVIKTAAIDLGFDT